MGDSVYQFNDCTSVLVGCNEQICVSIIDFKKEKLGPYWRNLREDCWDWSKDEAVLLLNLSSNKFGVCLGFFNMAKVFL